MRKFNNVIFVLVLLIVGVGLWLYNENKLRSEHEGKAMIWLDYARRDISSWAVDSFCVEAQKAKKDSIYFGTTKKELNTIHVKDHVKQAYYYLALARLDPINASYAIDNFHEHVRKSNKDIFYFGTSEEELEELLREYNIAKAKLLLEVARSDPSNSKEAIEFFRYYAVDAKKNITFFGTSEEELRGLLIHFYIAQARFMLQKAHARGDSSEISDCIELFRLYAKNAEKNITFFGTTEKELTKLLVEAK